MPSRSNSTDEVVHTMFFVMNERSESFVCTASATKEKGIVNFAVFRGPNHASFATALANTLNGSLDSFVTDLKGAPKNARKKSASNPSQRSTTRKRSPVAPPTIPDDTPASPSTRISSKQFKTIQVK